MKLKHGNTVSIIKQKNKEKKKIGRAQEKMKSLFLNSL